MFNSLFSVEVRSVAMRVCCQGRRYQEVTQLPLRHENHVIKNERRKTTSQLLKLLETHPSHRYTSCQDLSGAWSGHLHNILRHFWIYIYIYKDIHFYFMFLFKLS